MTVFYGVVKVAVMRGSDLNEVLRGEEVAKLVSGRALHAEGAAAAQVPRRECVWHVKEQQGSQRQQEEAGRAVGKEVVGWKRLDGPVPGRLW